MWLYILIGTVILWLMINVVNCSDGVDGVAGSQILLGLMTMGCFLYGIIGHSVVSAYLLLPLVENGASWSIVMFTAAGGLAAYLWYNAHPSQVLMGDAGSRFYGMLLGIAVLVSGNPFMFLVAAPILFVNGGAGLVKLVILRILKKCGFDTRPPLASAINPIHPENFASDADAARQIWPVRFLHRYRFPVHDHCRRRLNWSDSQVLLRFMLLQLAIVPAVIVLLIKLR
jgi:phospho-N-acetylmuramoyl-pentapeptide-transferase